MSPVFGDIELARLIEGLEAGLVEAAAYAAIQDRDGDGFAIRIAGGVASCAEPGSPFNKVAGLGFEGVPSEDELEDVERRYAEVDSPVQVELSTLGDPSIAETLTRRGYTLVGFENVLGAEVDSGAADQTAAEISVRRSPDSELDAWVEVVVEGFAAADEEGVPAHEEFPREAVERAVRTFAAAGAERYSALVDGELAGGASFYSEAGVAYLAGAATAPAYRRRGVHGALLSARMAEAVARDCDVAYILTQPGSTSQRNVWRRGFELLYSRAVLVKA